MLSNSTIKRIRIQNRLTRRDLLSRVGSVVIAFLLATYFLDPVLLIVLFAVFLFSEASCVLAHAPSDRGSRAAAILLLVAGFSCAASLTGLSLALVEDPSPVAATVAVAILVTALTHCIIIRTAWIAFGLVTALPFVLGLAFVALELVPVAEIAPGELAIGATALVIGALYIGKSIWEMNLTRRRLMEANEAVSAASRERSRFFAAVSHEIRTPLNAICGMAELLADDRTPELCVERAHLLLRSARSLEAILSDILDQARLEAGKHVLNPRPADLRSEIETSVEIFRPRAEAKGLAFRLDVSANIPRLAIFDPQKTRQVLSNLVSNAIKYTKRGSIDVRVSVERSGEEQILTAEVTDTGPGMDRRARRALFCDYERLGADAIDGALGTGLGLAISRRFARMMGGDIEVKSAPGRGATFRFTAPIGVTAEVASGAPNTSAARLPSRPDGVISRWKTGGRAVTATEGPAVLIVDDTATNRYVERAYLKGFASRIDEAENGHDALELIDRNTYDVMLLDLQMPVLDGPSTLRVLRGGPSASLPVIVVTASSESAGSATPETSGVQAVLAKPVSKAGLISAIRTVITPDTQMIAAHAALRGSGAGRAGATGAGSEEKL